MKIRIHTVLFALLIPMLVLAGCTDNTERAFQEFEVDQTISAAPTSVGVLEDEITEIAYSYDDGGVLSYAQAVFKGEQDILNEKGKIHYTFCRQDEESGKAVTVIVTYDMYEQKVIKVSLEKGRGKLEENLLEPLWEGKNILFSELFEQMKANDSFKSKMNGKNPTLTIDYTSSSITPKVI